MYSTREFYRAVLLLQLAVLLAEVLTGTHVAPAMMCFQIVFLAWVSFACGLYWRGGGKR